MFGRKISKTATLIVLGALSYGAVLDVHAAGQRDKRPRRPRAEQARPTGENGPTRPGRPDRENGVKQRRFKAFTVEELSAETGESLSPDTSVTLPSGEKVPLEEALEEFNRIEQALNAEGHSFRDRERKMRIKQRGKDVGKLEQQRQTIEAAHFAPTAPIVKTLRQRLDIADLADALTWSEESVEAIRRERNFEEQDFESHQEWNKESGDPDLFSVYVKGNLDTDGTETRTRVEAEAHAGASVLGHDVDVIKGTAYLNAPRQGDQTVRLDLYLAGQSIASIDKTYSDWSGGKSWSEELDFGTSFSVPLIPALGIRLNGSVGISGEIGFGYEATVSTLYAGGQFNTNAAINAYAEAGVAAGIPKVLEIEVGAGGRLTLLDQELEIAGELYLDMSSSRFRDWAFQMRAYAVNDMTMLAGDLYLYAEFDFPWPFNKYDGRVEHEIFEWDGITVSNKYLFDKTLSLRLYKKS